MRYISYACLCLIFATLIFQGCRENVYGTSCILVDFETDETLDLFTWKCKTRFSLSGKFKKHGNKSLKISFYPARQVGFSTGQMEHDWSHSEVFEFWVFNPTKKTHSIFIRISDGTTKEDHLQAFEKFLDIIPGENIITLPVTKLYDSHSHMLDLQDITGFYIFMKDIQSKTVLYFDYFHLH